MSGKYRTIVADPPWPHEGFATGPGDAKRGAEREILPSALPYRGMSIEQICNLPVRALGEYRQTLVWHKTGNPSPFGGSVAPIHAEFLLVAIGRPFCWGSIGRLDSSVIACPKPYEHSRKPDMFLDLIEQVSPGPYVELFARRARFGWDYWGDESLGTVELSA
jgi:N6-adenosine-specific RNA methylase IME4